MKELTTKQAAEFLNISPERTRRLAEHGRIKVRLTKRGHRRYPLPELERIKPYVDVEHPSRPKKCRVCGMLFERFGWDFICPDCRTITKECECGCGMLIPKYSKRYKKGKPIINSVAVGHQINIYYDELRQDPEAWQVMCDKRREQWQDPEFQQKAFEGRCNTEHIHIAKIRNGERTDIESLVDKELNRLSIAFEPDYRVASFFIDCAVLSHKLAIEVDGTYFHQKPRVKKNDLKKEEYLTNLGWTVVHLTGIEVRDNVQKAVAEKVLPLLR